MEPEKQSHRYWAVVCLRCKTPIPLYAEPTDSESELQLSGSTAVAEMEPRVLLVWCSNCEREYPYSTSDIVNYSGPRPPLNLRFHPVFARSQGRKSSTRTAHG